jgi:signal transduction histidine kinase
MLQRSSATFLPGSIGGRTDDLDVICHELRNSLAIVRGAARLLRTPGGPDMKTAGLVIERQAGQMIRHIDDLLDPTRRGRLDPLILARLDLCATVRHAVDAIGPEIARRKHRLTLELPGEPIWMQGDGARLEQVFSNLLINAAKFTPDGGEIAISLKCAGDEARVRVRDSGVGIPAALLPRVFGMFVQGDVVLPGADKGRGIGLAVVRAGIELHGGTVTATSAGPGQGSEFEVVMPVPGTPLKPVIVTL